MSRKISKCFSLICACSVAEKRRRIQGNAEDCLSGASFAAAGFGEHRRESEGPRQAHFWLALEVPGNNLTMEIVEFLSKEKGCFQELRLQAKQHDKGIGGQSTISHFQLNQVDHRIIFSALTY